ncbi:MAG: SDR family oxidoreductase [Phycisphaerales bacterium]|nr:SDR family oxidoreductase [Phycisphaerales bacterium]
MKIKNSVALVTGSNRGIGRHLVETLLSEGAGRVYATGRKKAELDGVVALDPKRVVPLQLDVTHPEEAFRVAAAAKDVTLLINNAGVLDFGGVLEASPEAFTRNFAVNFYGPLNVTRAFVPVLTQHPGSAVVNILTLVALASMPGLGVYNASKAAAWSLTQSMRADLGKKHVQVFGVFPAGVDTDMLRGVETTKANPGDVASAILAGIEAGTEDIFPEAVSTQVYSAWRGDHKAVERQFASM